MTPFAVMYPIFAVALGVLFFLNTSKLPEAKDMPTIIPALLRGLVIAFGVGAFVFALPHELKFLTLTIMIERFLLALFVYDPVGAKPTRWHIVVMFAFITALVVMVGYLTYIFVPAYTPLQAWVYAGLTAFVTPVLLIIFTAAAIVEAYRFLEGLEQAALKRSQKQ